MSFHADLQGLRGHCPIPFFEELSFPPTGGFVAGRLCVPVEQLNATCCIPCPVSDWTYSDGFEKRTEVANWVNVAAMLCTAFLLLSFIVLPVKWTRRHYLSICLTIGVFCIEFAFLIPLATKPDQCFNQITPNDMRSDLSCAFSGAFILFGGWAVVIWVFWRALSLHLQICWEVIPGDKFFYCALIFGWGLPALFTGLTLSLTGVSYRFGNLCHINHRYGLEDFWGPLLAFATLGLVLQFITIGYCIQVYIKSLLDDKQSTGNSSVPTYSGSIATASAKQTYRRVKRVVELQWKGATIVLLIIGEVVFFSIVFVSMDNSSQVNDVLFRKALPWVTCLALTGGDKNQCLPQVQALVKHESVVIAVLICLGLSGFWCLLLLGRWSMIQGWKELIQTKILNRKHEFVSADVRRFSGDPRTYEMLDATKSTPGLNISSPDRAVLSPGVTHPLRASPLTPEPDPNQDYFDKKYASRAYTLSNYSNRTTPEVVGREWDHRPTQTNPTAFYPSMTTKEY